VKNTEIETCSSKCPECGRTVETLWMKDGGGCLSTPDYVLIADWAFHSPCYDKMLERGGQK